MLLLAQGGWSLTLLPALGGAVASFRRHGVDILRPTPADAGHPLATACFPLVPFANRIAGGRFTFDGEAVTLPPNVADQAHPLHGTGWLAPWRVVATGAAVATLAHDHEGDAHWPWAYAAEQCFTLDDDGLTIALTVTNRDRRAFPVSLGLHPYFAVDGSHSLRFDADAVWLTDATLLPTVAAPPDRLGDWATGGGVRPAGLIDNCYAGWRGEAVIGHATGDLRLSGTGTPFLHLYMPPGLGFFCAEPVTAMPDALNRALPDRLAPGERRSMMMRIAAG